MPVGVKARQQKPRPRRKPGNGNLKQGNRVQDPVPVAPLRDYYLKGLARGDFTVCSIAQELGWYRGTVKRPGAGTKQGLDTTRVQRMMGVRAYSPGTKPNGKKYGSGIRTEVNYDTAVLLCRAMGAWPADMRDENGDPIL